MSRSLTGGRPAREKEINEIRKSTDCTTGKMIFTKLRDKNVALLVNSGGIAAVRVLRSNASKLGGIYLGKIQNVAKNIDACFVEIAPGELCFLPLREAGTAHLTNRQPDGSLNAGDELVVMVTRDAQKTKRASVTTDPSRMKQQLVKNGVTPESASEALQSLLNQAIHKVCLTCLLAPSEAIYEALEQLADPSEYSEVLTDDPEIFHKLSESSHPLLQQKNLRLYDDPAISLRLLYSLERGMDEALDTRVWLKCGGYLVIEPTEAMTVIDVNSGKNESKKMGEETYYQVNVEAAEEVARQLRLRNLSGIIIVDFINMSEKENRQKLLEYLKMLTAQDPQHPRIVDMTPLGLVEITRKKSHPTLAEQWKKYETFLNQSTLVWLVFVIFHNFRKLFLVKTFLEYSLLKCYSFIIGNAILYLSFQRSTETILI